MVKLLRKKLMKINDILAESSNFRKKVKLKIQRKNNKKDVLKNLYNLIESREKSS